MKHLSLYLKPTDYCNTGCSHCYLNGSERRNFSFLKPNELKKILNNLYLYFKDKDKYTIDILWHGGEPLTLDIKDFQKLLDVINNFKEKLNIQQSIQTSLFPLFDKSIEEKKEWFNIFNNHFNSFVGTSYDFFGIRKYNNSEEQYWENLISIIKEMKDNNINTAMTVTINKLCINKEEDILKKFYSIKNIITSFQFEKFNDYSVKNKHLFILNSEFSDFLINTTHLNLQKYNINIDIINNAFNMLKYEKGRDKWSGNCLSENIVINPDGTTNNCPDKSHEESFGNIINDDFKDILSNKQRNKWIFFQKFKHFNKHCVDCEFSSFCNSGCPLLNNESEKECSGYKSFLKEIQKLL